MYNLTLFTAVSMGLIAVADMNVFLVRRCREK